MKLSTEQVRAFWKMWPLACQQQGWTREAGLSAADIDAKRKEFLRRCGFASLTLVDRVNGFTKVKNELEILIRPNIDAAREAEDQTINLARTLRWTIRNNLLPCLALYHPDSEGYLAEVIQDKFNRLRHYENLTLDDLDARPIPSTARNGQLYEGASQLEQVRSTLSARINTMRSEAGDSVHDMKLRAGLKCDCKRCQERPAELPVAVLEIEPLTVADVNMPF